MKKVSFEVVFAAVMDALLWVVGVFMKFVLEPIWDLFHLLRFPKKQKTPP